jgi:hypothetical protein
MKSNQSHIQQIEFEGNFLVITVNRQCTSYALHEISPKLLYASEKERNTFQITPSGLGIHWPLIDEDLSFSNL